MKPTFSVLLFLILLSNAFSADSPYLQQLNQLNEQREKALTDAAIPVNRRYQSALEQLLRRATQMNDLDAAIKIRQELEKVTSAIDAKQPPSTPAMKSAREATSGVSGTQADELRKRLADTFWTYQWREEQVSKSGQWVCLHADGTATAGWHQHARMGKWKVVGKNTIELSVLSGNMSGDSPGETLHFDPSLSAAGNRQRINQPKEGMLNKAGLATATAPQVPSSSPLP